MNNLLFFMQQLWAPALSMWPIWIGFIAVYIALSQSRLKIYSHWVVLFCVIFLGLVLLLRTVLLFAYPYEERTSTLVLKTPDLHELPLYVTYKYGDLTVSQSDNSSQLSLSARDVSNGYVLERYPVADTVNGKIVNVDAILLHRKADMSVLSKLWSKVNLVVPASFPNKEVYNLFDAHGTLDFTDAMASDVTIGLYYSDVQVYMPRTMGAKSYAIYGGNQVSGRIYLPDGPTYIVKDNSNSITSFPAQFEKMSNGYYQRKGDLGSIVSITIQIYTHNALELILESAHNK